MSSDSITEESLITSAEKHDDTTAMELVGTPPEVHEPNDSPQEDAEDLCNLDENSRSNSRSPPQREEIVIKKKYGGLMPKKPPLISKDHEHAFFDSADWALAKQKSKKGPLESLRPKLQRSPHHQARSRSMYAPSDGEEDYHNSNDAEENTEDHLGCIVDDGRDRNSGSLANPEKQG